MATIRRRALLPVLILGLSWPSAALFAVTLFTDGFESGTLCAWNATLGGECTCFDSGLAQMRPLVKPAPGQLEIGEWLPQPVLAPETLAEWFEVRALAAVDLNGLQAGASALGGTPLLAYGGNCLRLDPAGDSRALFARNAESAQNGSLPEVDAVFSFSLANASGQLQVGMDGVLLDSRSWSASSSARSIMIDSTGAQCDAPAGVSSYNGVDIGTPSALNSPPDCGGGGPATCFDVNLGASRAIVSPAPGQLVINEWMPDPALVADASGEWFEVKALAAVDLNGLQVGTAVLNPTPVVPAGGNCLHLEAGSHALLARSAGVDNGGLPPVDATFASSLVNSNGTLRIGVADLELDAKSWTASASSRSIMIDSDGSQCTSPDGVATYNGTDRGTPRTANTPPECP